MTINSKAVREEDILLHFYEQYKTLLYHTALSILRDPYRAEEALQEAFINITRYRKKLLEVPEGKVKSYLITVIKNQCYLMAEKGQKQKCLPLELAGEKDIVDLAGVEEFILAKETQEQIAAAILALSDNDREILILRYYHDRKGKEMASILGISHRAARARLHRAIWHLAELVKKEMKTYEQKGQG